MKLHCSVYVLAALACWQQAGLADDAASLENLRDAPHESAAAVGWFASLPSEQRRAKAQQLGMIVLDSDDRDTFVVAFGATRSPYPWALFVSPRRIELCAGNRFAYAAETDSSQAGRVQGICWSFKTAYDTTYHAGHIRFQRPAAGESGMELWLGETGWKYVGPALERLGDQTRYANERGAGEIRR
jgi:hypothetical protein